MLETTYSIFENEISITFNVKNIDDEDIYFSLGSHPCFFCPFNKEDDLNEYYLEFQCIEDASIFEIDKNDLLTGNKINYLKNTSIIRLNNKTFSNGTLIFDHLKSKSVSLKSNIRDEEIKVELGDFKYLALWAPEETRPFICIEPWFGHADYNKFKGEFKEKEGIIKLGRGKEHTMSYKIILK